MWLSSPTPSSCPPLTTPNSILYNASFGIYNPYTDTLDVHAFPNYTLNRDFHVGGVAWDPYTGLASVIIGQGNAFETRGVNISGTNVITKYNPLTKSFLWALNITDVAQGHYGGFNDIAHDAQGNTYVCGTFPASILKIDPKGQAITEWVPPVKPVNQTIRGYSGIVYVPKGNSILVLDSLLGKLFRFDASLSAPVPVRVPHTPDSPITGGDAIRLPPKYNNTVLLIAENARGVSVLRSKAGDWNTGVEYLGLIKKEGFGLPEGALTTSIVQIGDDKIYAVTDWFTDPIVSGTVAGGREVFPMVDITGLVDGLVSGDGKF